MYENNNMYAPNMYPVQMGMQYAPNGYQKPVMTQPLTEEEMAILKDKGGAFTTKVTKEDMLKAYCTHKKNGAIVAFQNPDGTWTCPICGETFSERPLTKESLEEDIKAVLDDIQMIKLSYVDIPVEIARQYFPIVPLIQKIPQLGVIAANNFAKYEAGATTTTGSNPYGMAAYNQLMMGGAIAPMYNYGGQMMQQPMMAPMYQQPMMQGQQPMYQQPMMRGQQMVDAGAMVNPMNPTGGYPQQVMPQQAGMMMQQPVNPVAGNEFGTYGAPGYTAQPQPAAQAAPQAAPAPAPAAQSATPAPGAQTVDTTSFQL